MAACEGRSTELGVCKHGTASLGVEDGTRKLDLQPAVGWPLRAPHQLDNHRAQSRSVPLLLRPLRPLVLPAHTRAPAPAPAHTRALALAPAHIPARAQAQAQARARAQARAPEMAPE